MKGRKINWRSFVSLYITISMLIMMISGIILYFAPPGRVAYWTNWIFLGLSKTEWQAVHTIFTFIFIGFIGFHIYFNWKPLMHYIKEKTKRGLSLKKELAIATVINVLIFGFTFYEVPPFSTVMEFGEELSESWSNEETEPPVPHAEKLTVTEFAETVNISPDLFIGKLAENNITITDTSQTILDIANANQISPSEIYDLIASDVQPEVNEIKYKMGSGIGRKLLSEILIENNLTFDEGINKLKNAGINVENDEKIKNIAERNNISPIEIINAITN